MTKISDFSDDPKYTIKAVASQTGIRPVTLRAWERRHEVLTPHRAENQYRLYSERDVAILRWLKNRVDDGMPISEAISELRTMAKLGNWPEAVPTGPVVTSLKRANVPPAHYARQIYNALVKHDDGEAANLMREIQASFSLNVILLEILIPALVEIGEAWYRGEVRITTEHFASAFVRGRLLTMLQAYPARRNIPSILVGCAPSEQHEIGSLMLAVMLRSEGYRVEYLGPDLPLEDLADYAGYEQPAMVILSSTLPSSAMEMRRFAARLKKLRKKPIFAYGGAAFNFDPHLREQVEGEFLGNTLDEAVARIGELLAERKIK